MSNTKKCIDSSKRPCRVDLHVLTAMGILHCIKSQQVLAKRKSSVLCGLDGRYFGNEKI